MQAKLVTYDASMLNSYQSSRLSQKLYGYTDKSNHGAYSYKRSGILDDLDYIKISPKTFIVKTSDYKIVENVILSFGAKPTTWNIILQEE